MSDGCIPGYTGYGRQEAGEGAVPSFGNHGIICVYESRASLESATEASWFVLIGWERCLIFRGPERGALEREEFPGAGLRSKRNEARFSASLGKYHSFL